MDYSESFLTTTSSSNFLTSSSIGDSLSLIKNNTKYNEHKDTNIESIINSDLESATLKNDISKVAKLLSGGATIFANKNNTCQRLCNGYLDKRPSGHPSICDRTLCYKTSVYFGLVNNYLAYKTIYTNIYKLQYLDANLRIPCLCCNHTNTNTDPLYQEIRTNIINYTKGFKKLACECNQKYNYCKGYKEDYLHFNTVYNILLNIESFSEKLVEYYNININDLGSLVLSDFDSCIHAFVTDNPISNCQNVADIVIQEPINKIDVLKNLIQTINYYLTSIEILRTLFNQQAYEIYQYTLTQTCNEDDLICVINTLYLDKLMVHINYKNAYSHKSILDITTLRKSKSIDTCDTKEDCNLIKSYDLVRVVRHIFANGGIINFENNLLHDTLRNCFFYSALDIFSHSPNEHKMEKVNGQSIFKYIMNSEITTEMKLKFVEGLIGSGINLIDDGPIVMVLDHDESYDFLDLMMNDSRILDSIDWTHTDYAIVKRKADALTLLFKNGANPNGDSLHHIPLITYIDSLCDDEEIDSIDILASILSFNPELNIKDKFGFTSLHLAARYGYVKTLENLLDAGADAFIVNISTGETPLVTAIENDQFDIVNKLVLLEKGGEHLVNIENKNRLSPLMLAVHTRNPIKMIRQLEVNDELNYEYIDDFGKNILSFIIDTPEITNDIRYILFDILSKKLDLVKINGLETTPLIVRAMLRERFRIVRLLVVRLYENKQIIVNGDVYSFANYKTNDIVIETIDSPNFYNSIIKYLPLNCEEKDKFITPTIKNTMDVITTLAKVALAGITYDITTSSCY